MGATSGAYAAELCAKVFGRSEDSPFRFRQEHVDRLLTKFAQITNAEGYWADFEPTAGCVFTLELCASDL